MRQACEASWQPGLRLGRIYKGTSKDLDFGPSSPDRNHRDRQAFENFKEKGTLALKTCVKYAEEKKVLLLLEPINRYETNVINTLAEGSDLIREIESQHLKLIPDTFHMNIEERSLEESIVDAGAYIGYIHFADSNRLSPGWGHIDFFKIVSALKKTNYIGAVGIEVLPQPDDYSAAEQAIRYLNSMNI